MILFVTFSMILGAQVGACLAIALQILKKTNILLNIVKRVKIKLRSEIGNLVDDTFATVREQTAQGSAGAVIRRFPILV